MYLHTQSLSKDVGEVINFTWHVKVAGITIEPQPTGFKGIWITSANIGYLDTYIGDHKTVSYRNYLFKCILSYIPFSE